MVQDSMYTYLGPYNCNRKSLGLFNMYELSPSLKSRRRRGLQLMNHGKSVPRLCGRVCQLVGLPKIGHDLRHCTRWWREWPDTIGCDGMCVSLISLWVRNSICFPKRTEYSAFFWWMSLVEDIEYSISREKNISILRLLKNMEDTMKTPNYSIQV